MFSRRTAGQTDLYIVNPDGTNPVLLAGSSDSEMFEGFLSADRIVFGRFDLVQTDLYVVNADGTNEVRLTQTPETEELNCPSNGCETPGGRLVFGRRRSGTDVDLYSINLDGTGETLLAGTTGFEALVAITSAGRIVYQTDGSLAPVSQTDPYSINEDGTDRRALADSADSEQFDALY